MTRAATLPLTLLCAALTGCSGSFSANVANQSTHPVRVELGYTSWTGATRVLDSKRLAPGDAAMLGPAKAPRSSARLFAYPEAVAVPRASVNIPRGITTAHVIGAFLPGNVPGVDWRVIEKNPN